MCEILEDTKYKELHKIQNESRQLRKDNIWKMEDSRRVSEQVVGLKCLLPGKDPQLHLSWQRKLKESILSSQSCTDLFSHSGGHRDRNNTYSFKQEKICFVSVGEPETATKTECNNQAVTLVLALALYGLRWLSSLIGKELVLL